MQKLIDAHHHLWQLPGNIHYPWLQDALNDGFFLGDYAAIRKSFSAADLMALIPHGYELIATVHCEAECARAQALAEARWIAALGENQTVAAAQVAWVDLLADDIDEQLEHVAQIPGVRGVRYKPCTAEAASARNDLGKDGSLRDERLPRGLSALQKHHLIWDLRVPSWHLSEAAELLASFPALHVVLNHCGLPWDRSTSGLAVWREGMAALAGLTNCRVKLSELGCPGRDYDRSANQALLNEALAIFGQDKAMYAGNAPVSGLQIRYAVWLKMVETAIETVCPHGRQSVLWQNAATCYRIFQ